MKTALITVKTKPEIKEEAQKIAANLGFSLSAIVNAYLSQFVKNRAVYFSDNHEEEPTEYLLKNLRMSEEERRHGDYHAFDDPKKAVDFLDTIIDRKNA